MTAGMNRTATQTWIWTAVLAAAFAAIAAAIRGGALECIDRTLMLALRTGDAHDPIGPAWVETMFLELTGLGSTTVIVLVTLAAAGFLLIARKRATAALVVAAILGGTLLNNLLKLIFARPRPDVVAHSVEVTTMSFPSGHAMMSAAAYLTLGALLAQTQKSGAARGYILALAVVTVALIGVSRVYLGVHWPTDVIAGWLAGGAWALMCWQVARTLRSRGAIEKADD